MPSKNGLRFRLLSPDTSPNLGPRRGRLEVPEHFSIDTPNFLGNTSRGVIPHLTLDLLQGYLKVEGAHFALEDFLEKPNPPIAQCPTSKVTPDVQPLQSFTAFPSQTLTVLAARQTPYVSHPGNVNSYSSISIFTSNGFKRLTNKEYASYVKTVRPNIAISIADLPVQEVTVTPKRISKMTLRTTLWLRELLHLRKPDWPSIFAPILPLEPGDQIDYLEHLLGDLSGTFQGLAFYSAKLIPEIEATKTLTGLPRLSLEDASSPLDILQQVSFGIDLMVIPFITRCSEAGIAFDFQFPAPAVSQDSGIETDDGEREERPRRPLGTDLWSTTSNHSTSNLPLSPNCTCYTCKNHSVAYIHHLLLAKEMLAWTLLQIHNHHIITEFFASIRKCLREGGEGGFAMERDVFAETYEEKFPEPTGKGPTFEGSMVVKVRKYSTDVEMKRIPTGLREEIRKRDKKTSGVLDELGQEGDGSGAKRTTVRKSV